MNALSWTTDLKQIFEAAVAKYRAGDRGSATYFTPEQTGFLASIGHTAQEVYDFAEDHTRGGDPDWETFLLIASVRRDYFLTVQRGQHSSHLIDMDKLPPKAEAVDGIEWLPRLIQKAQAKLRGEMPDDLMYDCGGDRQFFRQWNLHPADFLRFAWNAGDDAQSYVPFVRQTK